MPDNDGPYAGLPDNVVKAANGVSYAYRDTGGQGEVPLVLLQHFLLAGLLPQARVKIYPDAAHGFLFQHHAEFAADVHAFLEEGD